MKVGEALPALIVGVLGAASAWLYLKVPQAQWMPLEVSQARWIPLAILMILLLAGLVGSVYGRSKLPRNPVTATRFMDFRILVPYAFASLASAIAIILAVSFTPPADESWDVETQKLAAATAAALTAFLTAGFIKSVDDADTAYVGEYVKGAFYAAYKRGEKELQGKVQYFPAGSDGERYVYSDPFKDIEGWGHKARLERARGVKGEL